MHHIPKPFTLGCDRRPATHSDDRASAVKSPIGFSAWVCLLCLGLTYWAARPLVGLLEGRAILLVYAVLPVSVTFVSLYRGGWHREIAGVPRTLALIFLSAIIFVGVLVASLILLILGALVYSRFVDGFTRIHY